MTDQAERSTHEAIGKIGEIGEIGEMTFDVALAELERTVATLEVGGAPLETTIELYERAVALEARCSALLADAKLRIERLVERGAGRIDVATADDQAADAGG